LFILFIFSLNNTLFFVFIVQKLINLKLKNMKTRITTKLSSILLIAIAVVVMASCKKEEIAPTQQESNSLKNIPEMLENFPTSEDASYDMLKEKGKKPTFKILKAALGQTGLMGFVASNELTLFAPTDEVFESLGITQQNISTVENLEEILLYHVLEGSIYSGDLTNGFFETLNGAAVEINLENGVFVNDAEVIYANLNALNGVVHVIDGLLIPPFMDIVETAISYNPAEFNTLVAAVVEAGLVEDLQGPGPFTVFAPTDAAFAELGITPANVGSVPNLAEVLRYHVVAGRVFSDDLTTGPVTTLQGQTIYIDATNLTIADNGSTELANLITAALNVQGTNGVIHVIDKVLLPSN
jgi:transforming growth factor-beta-induced protein